MKDKLSTAMSAMIQPIENVTYDLQSGLTGISTRTGIITYDGKELSKNPLDFFSMPIPAFAMLTPVSQVTEGDILVSDGKAYGFIQEITDTGSLRTINMQGHQSRFVPTKVNMMGIEKGVNIVKSFTSMFGNQNQAQGQGGMDMNTLMMMSMLSGSNNKMEDMLPLMMMSGAMGGGQMNPMMLMMMMGDKNPFG